LSWESGVATCVPVADRSFEIASTKSEGGDETTRRTDAMSVKFTLKGGGSPKTRRCRVYNMAAVCLKSYRNAQNTVGNFLDALWTRVYIPRTAEWASDDFHVSRQFKRFVHKKAAKLSRQIGHPLTEAELEAELRKFPENKRRLYRDALSTPLESVRSAARVTGFIKDEWTPVKPGKRWKPRAIQFRNPLFLAHFMRYYKPYEHAFYHGRYVFNTCQKFTCAKGFNPHQRAQYIEQLVSELDNCHVIDLDGSAFDGHVCPTALDTERLFFTSAVRHWRDSDRSYAASFLAAQVVNRCWCRAPDGTVRYTVRGNRMSGDLNTGCGNSTLQSLYIAYCMELLNIDDSRWRMFVDGDDALLFVAGSCAAEVAAALPKLFSHFNQEVKIGGCHPVDSENLEPIEFCQARMVRVAGSWRLVRNPYKVINCYSRTFRWSQNEYLMRRYFATIAPPEMIINNGVPVLHKYFESVYNLSDGAKELPSVARNYWRRNAVGDAFCESVDESTRLSFAMAFGISPEEQVWIEQCIGTERDGIKYIPPQGI
jgi:hypothetical protein